jgi:flagellar motor component MotA
MRKQTFDILSVVGLVLAFVAVMVGAILKGAGLSALLSSAAFMIVIVGTVAAICIQTPLNVMLHALRISSWVVRPPAQQAAESCSNSWSGAVLPASKGYWDWNRYWKV